MSNAVLSDAEVNRVLHFLGYTNWRQLAASIQLGFPGASQPLFLVYAAVKRLAEGGADSVRRDLCECESIEKQMSSARGRMKVVRLGEMTINQEETKQLRGELEFWVRRLADDLGVFPNPYSQMLTFGMGGSGGGINARVSR